MPSTSKPAAKVFRYLVDCAKQRRTPSYSEVGKIAGLIPLAVPKYLYELWDWCDKRRLPHLNAIVVNKLTQLPGSGYQPFGHLITRDEFEEIKSKVFDYDWNSVRFL